MYFSDRWGQQEPGLCLRISGKRIYYRWGKKGQQRREEADKNGSRTLTLPIGV